jgi:hypothetical protein
MGIGSAAGKAGASNSNSMTRVRTNIQAGKAHARGVFEPAVMPTADPVARPRGTRCVPSRLSPSVCGMSSAVADLEECKIFP